MKTTGALALMFAASAVLATPSPVEVDARATGVAKRSASLPTVTAKGNALYVGSERFYIIGLDYQPGGSSDASDPLADPSICKRDIPYFKELGINTVRVYTVDNSKNHDECMDALAEAGIYLAVDVNTPLYSLSQTEPAKSYNPFYLQSVFATVDAFASYSNTLLFFSGNEVLSDKVSTTKAAPYVKAVTRDLRQYVAERGYREILVGYSAADVSQNQYTMAQYMDCGADPTRSDFFALNNYEWCDPSSLEQSGWTVLADQYKNYSKPVFMSEYGCVTNTRTWAETDALYTPTMTVSFSGGMSYEYSEEGSGYGIVNINGNTVSIISQQFNDLKEAIAKISIPSGDGGATTGNGPQPCPGQSAEWDTKPFEGAAVPAIPQGAIQYFKNGAGPGPGLSGKGSQWETGGSSATASASAGAATQTFGNGSTGSSSAAPLPPLANLRPLMICGAALAFSFVFGATVL